ncbi:MAG: hypothetical protein R3211_06870 [Balneolaceae bacterium]|nr:hypothetical protein [Balneolaceae bacterium]
MVDQPSSFSDSDPPPSQPAPESRDPEIEREISLEEFNPKGTLTLTLLYFLIVALMWVFMYFVEFAGRGPSIIE